MSTLYRDYRPQSFGEILGQNHIKVTLQNEIDHGRLAQAYLFCGPRAVGKTTLARVLAKAVNCEKRADGTHEPCNKCASCLSITTGSNLDIIEIDAASNTGVDNVRENIIAFSRLAPSSAKFKVFIIDEVHMLSISAFNSLLKIIEEPPAYVIFILCTTEIQKVPSTIISRCERYDFKRISFKEVVQKLNLIANQEKISVDSAVLEAVARRSGGHLRDAESLLGQILSLGDKKITIEQAELVIPHYNSSEAIDLISHLSRKDAAKAVALINKLADGGVNMKIFAGEIIGLLRQIILNKLSPELAGNLGLDLGENLEKNLNQAAENLSWEQLLFFSRRFIEVFNDNKASVVPQLPLELAVVELCLGANRPLTSTNDTPPNSGRPRSTGNPISSSSSSTGGLTGPSSSPHSVNKKTGVSQEPMPSRSAPVAAVSSETICLSAEEVNTRWPEFLVKIKKYNHSLSFVLQNCQPRGIEDNELSLTFKYKFHQDRINDASIRSIVEKTLAEVFGVHLSVRSTIDENLDLRRDN
ncbi:MAG: DNA polymerase III subunit gamma/tau, partial [Patescibacteria group bacterium]